MHVFDGAMLATKRDFPDWKLGALKSTWRQARRFVFDEEASAWIGEFYRQCPDLVLSNLDFAIPPYETTYLELNITAANRGAEAAMKSPYPDSRGVLIAGSGELMFTVARIGVHHALLPYMYSLSESSRHTSGFVDDEQRSTWVDSVSRFLFGGAVTEDVSPEAREELVRRYDFNMNLPLDDDVSREFMRAQQGEFGLIITALLLLNQKRNVSYVDVPAKRVMTGNKQRPYAAHSMVHIDRSPVTNIRKAFEIGDRASPRRHSVRGHFMHFNISENCEHDWQVVEEGRRWDCAKCGGRRTWRVPFERGDAGTGFVTKDYEVKG